MSGSPNRLSNLSNMEQIFTKSAPRPGGHYSQAVKTGNLIFFSGVLPVYPADGRKELGDIKIQARLVLENISHILGEAGATRESIVKTTVYIADIDLWPAVNEVYSEFFGGHKPARAVVPVPTLHHGFSIEIEGVAEI